MNSDNELIIELNNKVTQLQAERDKAFALLQEAIDVLDYKKHNYPGWWAEWRAKARKLKDGG